MTLYLLLLGHSFPLFEKAKLAYAIARGLHQIVPYLMCNTDDM
jgi:hypothetical protein